MKPRSLPPKEVIVTKTLAENQLLSPSARTAQEFHRSFRSAGVDSQVGTPCGILAPLWAQTEESLPLVTFSREDSAMSYAAGQALAGGFPAVLMQNSGFGNCVNVMASLVCAYDLRLVIVVSLRGTANDTTPENSAMGHVTESILRQWGVPMTRLTHPHESLHLESLPDPGPKAVLIAPTYFGWRP